MTRRLLAIESATDWLSVALLEGEDVMALQLPEGSRQHAAALLPAIDAVFAEAGVTLGELDALAVSTGPGSFTSLRIGLATAKGLAFGRESAGTELVAFGISTLEAMALAVLESSTGDADSSEVLALLDARRGEWYAGSWRAGEGDAPVPVPMLPEGLYSPATLASDLKGEVLAVSPERAGWATEFAQAGLDFSARVEGAAARPRADWVGRLAQRRWALGEGVAVEALEARYMRRAEAEAKRLGGPVEAGEVARVEAPEG